MLLDRLERVPADSTWARRASGIRGALIKLSEQMEKGAPVDLPALDHSFHLGAEILREAAKERSRGSFDFMREERE
jgi:hypothetical protein